MLLSQPSALRKTGAFRSACPASIPKILLLGFAVIFFGRGLASAQNNDKSTNALPPASPLATLEGQPIFEEQLQPQVRAELEKLRLQEDVLKRKALDALLVQRLTEEEAKRKGVTLAEYLQSEIDGKVSDPTPEELNAYYLAQKDQIKQPFDEIKDKLKQALKSMKVQQARQSYASDLLARARESGKIEILLRPFRREVGFDAARLKGKSNAPVMIVEFSDFGCPFCRKAEASLSAVLAKYGDKVSLAYRDYPLVELHPTAEAAAEASRCAGEQGRFWEYHDLLFGNPEKQDRQGLLLNARILELDETRFSACLESDRYKAVIAKDREDGLRAGVIGTPGFFINGVFLDGAQPPEVFENLIDQELALHQKATPAAQ